jgi:hypothetical protein
MDYSAFIKFLKSQTSDSISCTFEQIEQILGKPMSSSAYKHLAWWSNSPTHPLMKEVLSTGWMSKKPNLKNKTISFYKNSLAKQKAVLTKDKKLKKSVINLEKEEKFRRNRDTQLQNSTPDFVVDSKNIYFEQLIDEFVSHITKGKTEIYNEASVQYELAIFLREKIPNYKIQLERNVKFFNLEKKNFVKKEIDIVLFNKSQNKKFAIEIKYPTSIDYPNQMFHFCQDIKFLEQLKEVGFTDNFFLALTPQSNFWGDNGKEGTIYEKFRKEKELYGEIKNEIGDSTEKVNLKSRHKINWLSVNDTIRYFTMRI